MSSAKLLLPLAAERKSADVTDWAARIGWVVGLLLFIALVYWLMRQGWKWRGSLQSDLPELPTRPSPTTTLNGDGKPPLTEMPEQPGEARLRTEGRYHGSTTAGQWLDRIVAHGLGSRSRVELTLTDAGLDVVRPGANDFFIPVERLREARLDKGIAGKVLAEGGLLIVTWQLGDTLIDSGFRSDRSAEHAAWVEAINSLTHLITTEGPAR
ncbi:PH-like domain-containing protein [Streptomyces sp. NBC_01429]|uniref:PH-like domain-containing protein n=1 Tax=Streptomyces sp. NBC_01429 TaxID=2903862 RepID=UPI003FCCE129